MCDKAILENGGILKCVPNCFKNHEMCNKAVGKYSHTLEFVPNCYMTQEMCVNNHSSTTEFVPECYKTLKMYDKAFNKCFLAFFCILDRHKTQEMCDTFFSDDPFLLRYVTGQYKAQ